MSEEVVSSARGARGKFQRFRKALARLQNADAGLAQGGLETFIVQKFGVGYKTARDDVRFLEGVRAVKIQNGVVSITETGFAILDGGRFPGEA